MLYAPAGFSVWFRSSANRIAHSAQTRILRCSNWRSWHTWTNTSDVIWIWFTCVCAHVRWLKIAESCNCHRWKCKQEAMAVRSLCIENGINTTPTIQCNKKFSFSSSWLWFSSKIEIVAKDVPELKVKVNNAVLYCSIAAYELALFYRSYNDVENHLSWNSLTIDWNQSGKRWSTFCDSLISYGLRRIELRRLPWWQG